ncbi:Streptothricin acetyltransferase A [Paenibacillus solanacearum]|uniref:Streptothricin acetyltransferase A n=1 Tax=Paenibacillus solanacearum TaxID=2048548 RepID=A0A916K3V2_9BACL|nr:GNAT family N-acetyltransferase [Paenibacillus solanacearum]CAG7621617.1 Streptothricin acetyltransferase A [Paenibacillus solanacearum]
MDVFITKLNEDNVSQIRPIDDSFLVDSILIFTLADRQYTYTLEPIASCEKRYSDDPYGDAADGNYGDDMEHPDRAIYLAFADRRFAGLIQLKRNWNNYALVEDIKVDRAYRRHGIGRRLIEQAKLWAAAGHMPGLMLETQNNNVKACRFYESCGFVIGGVDFHVYKGIDPDSGEAAVYWYYFLNE